MKKLIAGVVAAAAITFGYAAPANAIISEGSSTYSKVCAYISEHPTADGVLQVVLALHKAGYTKDEIAQIVVTSVKTVCPENIKAVQKFVDKYADPKQTV